MKHTVKRTIAAIAAAACLAQTALPAVMLSVYAEDSAETAQGTPPERPDGDSGEMGTPPDKPDGDMGTPPERPDGDSGEMGTPPGGENGEMGTPPDGMPGGMGGGSAVSEWDAMTEYSEDTVTSGESYTSTGTDENAVLVSGGEVTLDTPTITRTSEDSTGGDNASFYGVGAALLATDGTAYVNGGTVTTDSEGGAGLFAYADGTVYVQDTTIRTSKNTSGGIHAAGGGTLYAWDLDVETDGGSSAAIRSDRGGGTMVIDGGTYTANGVGSPAVYCTADIAVNNATLNATGSEGVCIEGLNSLYLFDSDLTSNMPVTEQNENLVWSVIVYQSMSGDSEVGNSEFYMDGGSISGNGDILYTTNTESHITLKNVTISSTAEEYAILRATGNANGRGWGSTGANGADCTFTAIEQELSGNILYDSISNLTCYLTEGSVLTGAVLDDETDAGEGGDGVASLYIDSSSTWIVTANSTCTYLYNAGTITDENGKSVTIADADGNILSEGDSDITVTVVGYEETADTSGATAAASFDSFAVEKPAALTLTNLSAEANTEAQTDAAETDNATQAQTEASTEPDEQTSGSTLGWIAVWAAGVAAIAAGAFALVRHHKKNTK